MGWSARPKRNPTRRLISPHLRFTVLEGERGLGRGISELRFVVGDKELGPGAKASGDNGFETMFDGNNRTLVKWKSGRNAAITCDDPVAPTAVKLWTSEGGRGVRSFRVEGAKADSTDGLNWVELLHYDAGDGKNHPQRQMGHDSDLSQRRRPRAREHRQGPRPRQFCPHPAGPSEGSYPCSGCEEELSKGKTNHENR